MEQVRAARRSASHGSMNRRYAADTGFSPRTVDSNPFTRRPLRSVNENTCLLNRPGPLESMLKTTTETGDIGLFSIRPSRSTTNFHRPLYAQSDSGDENWQRSPRDNMIDTPTFRHNSRRTTRPRDMASEIVSMHGSTSQRSASSTFSQPLDDPAQRTYSMTSCSSRPMSSKKSNGTLQSQSSGTFLQRPRSPFPYPARLRRPGMRPSSPAWTDNGAVDYSRMIQIDRIPHRTVHDLRKPAYPHSSRRATPGLSRPDANRSMSLSSASSLAVAERSTGRISIAPTISGSEYRGRLDSGKSNNSLTSSSPTSIGGMHRPPYPRPVQNHSSRAHSGGVLFYDYTEQFEEAPPVVKPPLSPLAPIPTRAPSFHRHMLLDERYTLRFRDANIQNVTTVLRDSSPTELDSEQKSPKNQQNLLSPTKTLPDASSRLFPDPPMDPRAYRSSEDTEQGLPQEGTRPSHKSAAPSSGFMVASTSDIGRLQSPPAKCTRQQPEAMEVKIDLGAQQDKTDWGPFSPMSLERYDMAYKECLQHSALPQRSSVPESGDIHRSMSLSCETRESPSYIVSGYLRRNKSHSPEYGSSNLVLPVKSPGHANARYSVAYHQNHHRDQGARKSHESADSRSSPAQHADTSFPSPSRFKDCGDHEGGECSELCELGTYRRPYGISSSNHNAKSGVSEGDRPPGTEYRLPIFAPEPVSPARRLKLRNSVSQLMKALPVLPSPRDSISSDRGLLPGELDSTMVISSRSDGDSMPAFQKHTKDGGISKSSNGKLRFKVPRHGIPETSKVPISPGPVMTSKSPALQRQGFWENTQEEENTHGLASTKTNSHHTREDGVSVLGACVDGVGPPSGPQSTTYLLRHATAEMEDLFIGEPLSPWATIHSSGLASTSDVGSAVSDGPASSHKPPRGLRKRVSDLRTRLAESRLKYTEHRGSPGKGNFGNGELAHTLPAGGADDSHEKNSRVDDVGHPPATPRRLRGRMSKWMTAVRESIMAACGGLRKRG